MEQTSIISPIYIPVWFDLKQTDCCWNGNVFEIYIPVWFDLKYVITNPFGNGHRFTFQYGSI